MVVLLGKMSVYQKPMMPVGAVPRVSQCQYWLSVVHVAMKAGEFQLGVVRSVDPGEEQRQAAEEEEGDVDAAAAAGEEIPHQLVLVETTSAGFEYFRKRGHCCWPSDPRSAAAVVIDTAP
jgi:hypothetical protein